jgi:hypothetical protein
MAVRNRKRNKARKKKMQQAKKHSSERCMS